MTAVMMYRMAPHPRESAAPAQGVPHVERRLAAILSADVKGYSRLMGANDVATVETLTAYREVIAQLVGQQRGRVVDAPGDELLAEFHSVVDAVQSSVSIQEALEARNAGVPDDRRMEFRIGVNLGEVIAEGERIYGDGVNVAARIQALAEGGGVCISGSVYDEIANKLPLDCESLGEHTLKNIEGPVRVFRVRLTPARGDAPPGPTLTTVGQASKRSETLSVAVLPFANMSGDPEQEHFTNGITDDIITDLSKIGELTVIARSSTFAYKDTVFKIPDIGRELGVRYVLEGSVRKVGEQVRITAQLVDAVTAHHLWAERYDRDLKDVFAIQDEISHKIAMALKLTLTAENEAPGPS